MRNTWEGKSKQARLVQRIRTFCKVEVGLSLIKRDRDMLELSKIVFELAREVNVPVLRQIPRVGYPFHISQNGHKEGRVLDTKQNSKGNELERKMNVPNGLQQVGEPAFLLLVVHGDDGHDRRPTTYSNLDWI